MGMKSLKNNTLKSKFRTVESSNMRKYGGYCIAGMVEREASNQRPAGYLTLTLAEITLTKLINTSWNYMVTPRSPINLALENIFFSFWQGGQFPFTTVNSLPDSHSSLNTTAAVSDVFIYLRRKAAK